MVPTNLTVTAWKTLKRCRCGVAANNGAEASMILHAGDQCRMFCALWACKGGEVWYLSAGIGAGVDMSRRLSAADSDVDRNCPSALQSGRWQQFQRVQSSLRVSRELGGEKLVQVWYLQQLHHL